MSAIFYAESGLNPQAIGDTKAKCPRCKYRSYGVAQLNGGPFEGWDNPEVNIAYAYAKYQRQGKKAWSVYNSGKYKKYINIIKE